MRKKVITTSHAPRAIGPYSQAIDTGSFIFTAGQVAMDPATGKLITGGIKEQTRQVMENLKAVLTAVECDFSKVVKVTVFLADLGHFAEMNQVYASYFPTEPPARSAFQVAALPLGALVEIEMIVQR